LTKTIKGTADNGITWQSSSDYWFASLSQKHSCSGFVQCAEHKAEGTFSLPLFLLLPDVTLLCCFWQEGIGVRCLKRWRLTLSTQRCVCC